MKCDVDVAEQRIVSGEEKLQARSTKGKAAETQNLPLNAAESLLQCGEKTLLKKIRIEDPDQACAHDIFM